jgi:hypothetical protein
MMNDFTALNDESWASGQDMEEPKVFDVLTTVVVRVEADDENDAESMVDRDLYCGDIDTWTAQTAERVYEDK